jgi:transposase
LYRVRQLGSQTTLAAFIVLIRQTRKQRKSLTFKGNKRRSKSHQDHLRREREPWILVASLSLRARSPKQIVKIYKTRMQIEEGFRDCKSRQYGLYLSQHKHMNQHRRSVLCLVVTGAIFVLWCIGMAAKHSRLAKQVRVNSSQ